MCLHSFSGLDQYFAFYNQNLMKNMLNLCVFNTSIDPLKPPFVMGRTNFEKLVLFKSYFQKAS